MKRMKCLLLSLMLLSLTLTGCDSQKDYVVQYADHNGLHTVQVEMGLAFELKDELPYKEGYVFLGLFDQEVGGNMIVNSSGVSVGVFDRKTNLMLYPQFAPMKFNLDLDFQGATPTGARRFEVEYDGTLPDLPLNLSVEHKNFMGWFLEPDCEGTQIADTHGILPGCSKITSSVFDISKDTITLYAGFEYVRFDVTFHFGYGLPDETMKVQYGTDIQNVVPKTRKDGFAVLSWSLNEGGDVFHGQVLNEMELYAIEYAPCIEFDVNGGKELTPLVARAGTPITLPTPQKRYAEFVAWVLPDNTAFTWTTMPSNSVTIKALWMPKIVFNVNGGETVADIVQEAGTELTLPKTSRDGYLFAGWYKKSGELFTARVMPEEGLELKAGWYLAIKETKVLYPNTSDKKLDGGADGLDGKYSLKASRRLKIVIDSLTNIPSTGVMIDIKVSFQWGNDDRHYSAQGAVALYEGSEFSSAYELGKKTLKHDDGYSTMIKDYLELKGVTVHTNELYFYYAAAGNGKIYLNGGYGYNASFTDITAEILTPNTARFSL